MVDKLRVVMTSAALALSLSGTGLTQTLVEEMGATQIGSTLQQSGMPVLGRVTAPAAQPPAAPPAAIQPSPIQPAAAGVSTQAPAQGTPPAGAAPLLPVSRPTPAYLSALDAARRSLQAGNPRQARQQYERLVAQDYQNPQAHFGLGLALFGLGDLQGARFEFGQLISLDPAGFEGPYNLGVIASRQGQSAEALSQFGKAAELARGKVSVPVLRQVLEALASEQARRGDYAALALTLVSLTANQPDDLGLRFRQAQALRLSGQGTLALPLLYGVRQKQPGQVDAALLTADIYAGQGLYDRGIRELDAALGAVKDSPSRSRLLLRRSDLLALAGRTHDAVLAAQAAVQADGRSAPAQARLGELRFSRGDAQGALAAWSAAVSLTPTSAAYRANLATVRLSLEQLVAAVGDARAAVRLSGTAADDPAKARAQFVLGVAAYRRGAYADARSDLSASVAKLPDPSGYLWLGLSSYALRDYPAAAAALGESVRLQPTPVARLNLGSALLASGRYPEAEAVLRAAVVADAGNADAWYRLGLSRRAQGRETEARNALKTAAQLGSAPARGALK